MERLTDPQPGAAPGMVQRHRLEITGTVQGVGFRPFLYRLATRYALSGFARNHNRGVEVELEGSLPALRAFEDALRKELPPLARPAGISLQSLPPEGGSGFRIEETRIQGGGKTRVPPDAATCPDCLRELNDEADRRFGYPFINCTHCGPRYTLIRELPYDRERTSMAHFALCADCRAEYGNPEDRRFHAEPVACAVCGPRLRLLDAGGAVLPGDPLTETARLLGEGAVIAVKGLGGFHLACNAANESAVSTLRERKHRSGKPLAVMVPDLAAADRLCHLTDDEARLLTSPARPIVLLRRRPGAPLAPSVAPHTETLGLMLPYTPLHHLLMARCGRSLVMTSGNGPGAPIVHRDDDARRHLSPWCDATLTHDREIYNRCDDSVLSLGPQGPVMLRRARGYAPAPVRLPGRLSRPVLATGGALKVTFCLADKDEALLSPHIGDLEHPGTWTAYEDALTHYRRVFGIEPAVVAHDLHPDYPTSRFALAWEGTAERVAVQHHHAHVAACMADNGIATPVLGVAFDGAGYGTDGRLWGGEFLLADYTDFRRVAHWDYIPLPGGERAIREPWRLALGLLLRRHGVEGALRLGLPVVEGHADALPVLKRMLERGFNTPLSSGVGRLFDAVAVLLTGREVMSYEGQAAVALEQLADPIERGALPVGLDERADPLLLDSQALFDSVLEQWSGGVPPAIVAVRFHNAIAEAVACVCRKLADRHGERPVVLTGGVFQNRLLLHRTWEAVTRQRLTCYTHRLVPPNDGGLALGQAVIGGGLQCA